MKIVVQWERIMYIGTLHDCLRVNHISSKDYAKIPMTNYAHCVHEYCAFDLNSRSRMPKMTVALAHQIKRKEEINLFQRGWFEEHRFQRGMHGHVMHKWEGCAKATFRRGLCVDSPRNVWMMH